MRLNKKYIQNEIKRRKFSRGESIARYRKKIMIQKWQDKKDVLMISTIHDET